MNLVKPTAQEKELLYFLINRSSIEILPSDWLDHLLVQHLYDGEMGSLRLFPYGEIQENSSFGKEAGNYEFTDADGVVVIATLYLDQNNQPFELDIWKTDFTPLISTPTNYPLL